MDSKVKVINKLIEVGNEFTTENFCFPNDYDASEFGGDDTAKWLEWKTRAQNIIDSSMAENSAAVKLANRAVKTRTSGHQLIKFEEVRTALIAALKNTMDALKEDAYGELKQKESTSNSPVLSNKIFIVHGHDSQLKTDVERFIHEIGLEPIVLHRQADKGNTVIEKFEENSDVGYAFILLTPDEIAMTKDQLEVDEADRVKELRARPNVIFEFGYFVGKLGRSKVCCLHKGDVEIPSDLAGLVYKKVDESIDAQAYAIIKELKSAGYDIRV
ncbi:TIR domain-containing protein [Cognaticolwellia aestuarii]|uniref:TIR domain-containing protein n=1 Tax=Cognaticolwellia aestuarii TaxID=329993 RepID=UPI000984A0B5|nr:nucleotide-binding protein [Cognaticolwellia aestuarii]